MCAPSATVTYDKFKAPIVTRQIRCHRLLICSEYQYLVHG